MEQTCHRPVFTDANAASMANRSLRWPHWVVGTRADRVCVLLVGMCLMNGFDLMLTILAGEQGVLHESNPIAAQIVEHGPGAITGYKLALLIPPTIVLYRFRNHRMSEMAAFAVFLIYVNVSVRWHSVYELYLVSNPTDYYAIPRF